MAQRIIISQTLPTTDGTTVESDVLTLTRPDASADTLTLAIIGGTVEAHGAALTLDNDTARDLALAILAWVGKAPRAVVPVPVPVEEETGHASVAMIEAAIAAGEASVK